MECPRVTVLLSVYNGDRFLREAIDSVLGQAWEDFELLVVNDGSTDGTATILKSYSDARLQIITNERNIGVPASLNRGLAHARGEYIARIDADDLALPERLVEQVQYLDRHPQVGLVACATEFVDEDGTAIRVESFGLIPEQLYYTLTFVNCIHSSSVTFRKELILDIGGYDESMRYAIDYDLWLRVSRRTKIVKLRKVLAKWRDSDTNISRRFKAEQSAFADMAYLKNLRALMGTSINVDEALCFHNVAYPNRDFSITYPSLLVLERIHERLIENRPQGLQKREVERCCDYALGRYIVLMALHAQVFDALRAFFKIRYYRPLVTYAQKTIRQIVKRDSKSSTAYSI
jgi:glycosyltransferase involved in cell wall biosynthesis